MQLKKGAEVFSSAGEKVGSVDRVVINPATKEVTHIVVEKGVLFPTNKVIPIEYINLEEGGRIGLEKTAEELEALPAYDPSAYVNATPIDEADHMTSVPSVYWYPPVDVAWWTASVPMWPTWYPKPQYVAGREVIPDETVALEEGAKVFSRDGDHIGNVEQVIVDPTDHLATHIVISEGFLLTERKLVPTLWIRDVDEEQITLSVDDEVVDRLPAYQSVP